MFGKSDPDPSLGARITAVSLLHQVRKTAGIYKHEAGQRPPMTAH
jgi:hypothetical protein